jgi:hypothetical protein
VKFKHWIDVENRVIKRDPTTQARPDQVHHRSWPSQEMLGKKFEYRNTYFNRWFGLLLDESYSKGLPGKYSVKVLHSNAMMIAVIGCRMEFTAAFLRMLKT